MPSPLTLPMRYTTHQPPCGTPLRNPVLQGVTKQLWTFNEGAGATLHDSSPRRQTATLTGGGTWAASMSGREVIFNGVSQYVTAPAQDLGSAGSIEALLTILGSGTPDAGNVVDLVSNVGSKGQHGWSMGYRVDVNKIDFYIANNGSFGTENLSNSTLIRGERYHIVCSYDGLVKRIYINGELDSSFSTSVNGTSGNGWGIASRLVLQRYANISVEKVSLLSRILTPAEVRSLYVAPFQIF